MVWCILCLLMAASSLVDSPDNQAFCTAQNDMDDAASSCLGGPSVNPGFQARITQNGLNYANTVAVDVLSSSVSGKTIEPLAGHDHHVDYDLSNLQITGFTRPSSSMSLNPPTGLLWKVQNVGIAVHGDFHYKYKKKVVRISDHGKFDVSVEGLGFNLNLLIGTDGGGRPSIKSGGCSCSVGSVHVTFHGGRAWIYNIFKSKVADALKKVIEKKMNGIIDDLINKDAERSMSELKVMTDIGKVFLLDYRLVQKPAFTSTYMETFHKGEVYWKSEQKEAPFTAAVFPPISESNHMMYVWMSDYIVNSMMYQAQQNGFLVYNLTSRDLPDGNKSLLNTTCVNAQCIENFIPALKQFPDCQVTLLMASKVAPKVVLNKGQIQAVMDGEINFLATHPGDKAQTYLFTLDVNATLNVTLRLKDVEVFFKVTEMELKVEIAKTAIKGVSEFALQLIMNVVVKNFVKDKLNDLGAKGFPLPLNDKVELVNTQLKLVEHALIIATDINYQH